MNKYNIYLSTHLISLYINHRIFEGNLFETTTLREVELREQILKETLNRLHMRKVYMINILFLYINVFSSKLIYTFNCVCI